MATVKIQNGKAVTKGGLVSCECCVPQVLFEQRQASTSCEDTCGETNTIWQNESDTIGDESCSYVATTTVNVPIDQCQYYRYFRRIDDYTVVLGDVDGNCEQVFPNSICDKITEYSVAEDGSCSSVQTDGPTDQDCIGAGNSRDITIEYSDPINDCLLVWPEYTDWQSTTSISVSAYKSRSGNLSVAEKITYRIPQEILDAIPSSYNIVIVEEKTTYDLAEGSCVEWVANSPVVTEYPYTGQETELDAISEIPDGLYGVEFNLTLKLVKQ